MLDNQNFTLITNQSVINQPVNTPFKNPSVNPVLSNEKQSSTKYMKIILIMFFLILLVLVVGYLVMNTNNEIIDKQYFFKFANTKGWKKIPPKEGAYLSLATTKDNIIISYVDIRPLLKEKLPQNKEADIQKLCNDTIKQINAQNIKFEPIQVNNVSGFKCSHEEQETNTSNILQGSEYTLFKGDNLKYIYIIIISYPKDNIEEANKVEQLIQGFQTL